MAVAICLTPGDRRHLRRPRPLRRIERRVLAARARWAGEFLDVAQRTHAPAVRANQTADEHDGAAPARSSRARPSPGQQAPENVTVNGTAAMTAKIAPLASGMQVELAEAIRSGRSR